MFNEQTPSQIKWLKNDQTVTEGERYRFVNEGGFHCIDVAPVTTEDSGRWVCQARNVVGLDSSGCHLNVLGERRRCDERLPVTLKKIFS